MFRYGGAWHGNSLWIEIPHEARTIPTIKHYICECASGLKKNFGWHCEKRIQFWFVYAAIKNEIYKRENSMEYGMYWWSLRREFSYFAVSMKFVWLFFLLEIWKQFSSIHLLVIFKRQISFLIFFFGTRKAFTVEHRETYCLFCFLKYNTDNFLSISFYLLRIKRYFVIYCMKRIYSIAHTHTHIHTQKRNYFHVSYWDDWLRFFSSRSLEDYILVFVQHYAYTQHPFRSLPVER